MEKTDVLNPKDRQKKNNIKTADFEAEDTAKTSMDIIADLEATLNEVAESNPRIEEDSEEI